MVNQMEKDVIVKILHDQDMILNILNGSTLPPETKIRNIKTIITENRTKLQQLISNMPKPHVVVKNINKVELANKFRCATCLNFFDRRLLGKKCSKCSRALCNSCYQENRYHFCEKCNNQMLKA